jgi:glycerol-3-phosphate O-acyltransferase
LCKVKILRFSIGFGKPLRLSDMPGDDPEVRTQAVADELMARIRAVVPVLSTPLVAHVLLEEGPLSRKDLAAGVQARLVMLKSKDMPLPRKEVGALVADTLKPLLARGFVSEVDDQISISADGKGVISYYANSIAHHFSASDA